MEAITKIGKKIETIKGKLPALIKVIKPTLLLRIDHIQHQPSDLNEILAIHPPQINEEN